MERITEHSYTKLHHTEYKRLVKALEDDDLNGPVFRM